MEPIPFDIKQIVDNIDTARNETEAEHNQRRIEEVIQRKELAIKDEPSIDDYIL